MGESEKEQEKTENGTHAGMPPKDKAHDGATQESGGKDAADCKSAEKPDTSALEKSGEASSGDALSELQKQIDALKKENADLKDQLLRRAADFDNYRKRMLKEKQDVFDYANENLLHDLLESLDNFDRATDAAANAKDVKSIADGVKMINASLVKMLEDKYNLSSYGAEGDAFNPDEHEAIGSVQGAVAEPVLKEVYLKGYKLKDRIIRHAKVMVTMPDGSVQSDEKAGQKSDSK